MRRPPFQVNPLALSVALLLAAPVAAVAQDFSTPYLLNVSIPKADTLTVTAGSGQGVVTATNVIDVSTGVTTATTITVDGVVQGAGQLVKQGDGTLSLTT